MTDYKKDYDNSITRCQMCGREIPNGYDNGSVKLCISDEKKFFDKFGAKPLRTEAWLCGRCNHSYNEWMGKETEAERLLALFADPCPEFEKTWRADLEERDMLQYFCTLQAAFRALEEFTKKGVDTCVKRVFMPDAECEFSKGKRSREKCNNCLRRWLISESSHNRKDVQVVHLKKRVRQNYDSF